MSADNWAICPRCFNNAQKEYIKKVDKLRQDYGKVPAEEYVERLNELTPPDIDSGDFTTFREDYEFYGAETGSVTVSYSGTCINCGLSCDFETEEEFYVKPRTSNSC